MKYNSASEDRQKDLPQYIIDEMAEHLSHFRWGYDTYGYVMDAMLDFRYLDRQTGKIQRLLINQLEPLYVAYCRGGLKRLKEAWDEVADTGSMGV